MQINPIAPSNITQARPSATAAVAEPPAKAAPAPKAPAPAAPKAPAAEAPAKTVEATTAKVEAAAKTTEGSKAEITDVKATGEKTEEGEPTFTMKVNGKEVVATQSQILALAQKAAGADAAFKAKADIEKLASNFLTSFDNDAFALMVQRHGKEKAKEMAIGMVRKLIAEEEKTPEQRELEELRDHKKASEAQKEAAEKEVKELERKGKQATLYKNLLTEIDTELNDTHLPKDKLTLTRVLNYLAAGKKSNGQNWTVREAVKAVEVEDMSHASYYAKRYVEGKLPSEKFREIFGEETFKKLNKDQIEALKKADKIVKNGAEQETRPAGEAPKKRTLSRTKGSEGMSEREWRKQHGSLGGI